ncbi:SDR family NAD(P)-dependent oxidoreductase [Flavihumibacter rivuli]|uniref:SDR family NAD(P)-dependent oxidoreductase n=1 Tax=Flavihumibacter rivuli TaxID=2838156 RepID=UPI001BDF6358|nr:SDR family NAD(P)-dependent oxidoreductase [Flavihumibacter rivuli]ULQ56770.1 SDR family NAD(P)-dependent oxidoreductase [Flavihumibacter rivuli]
MAKTILITGATAGFGRATAEKFASNGWDLIITGRRKDRLDELQQSLVNRYGVRCLALHFDVRNKESVFETFHHLPEDWQKIDILVNNAGLALGRDYFDEADLDDWETMIDTNLKGLLYVSKAILPYFIKRGKGHIINIGSTAGKEVYEKGNVYCASKHAVDAISKAMRIDLLRHKVKVTAIHPGAAETEFSLVRFKGDNDKASQVYAGYEALTAEDIADTVWYTGNLPEHVCINDLVITCTAQANSFHTYKG